MAEVDCLLSTAFVLAHDNFSVKCCLVMVDGLIIVTVCIDALRGSGSKHKCCARMSHKGK
jgi:hypothetical protein